MASPLGAPAQSFHRLPTRGRTTPPCPGGLSLSRGRGGTLATSSPSAVAPSPGFLPGLEPPSPPARRHPVHHRSRCRRRLPGALPWGCSQFLETCKYSSDLNVIFFSPLQPLQSKDYLLHTHAAALFSRINQCSTGLPGERTRRCPSGPVSSPGNVAWPRPRPGTARTSRLVSLCPPALWCPVPPGSSRPWGFCLSG